MQVPLFPFEAGSTRPGEEPDPSFSVDHLPMLRGVVECDIRGALDLQPPEFIERNSLGPKTKSCAIGVELNVDVHGSLLMNRWCAFEALASFGGR